MPVSLSAQSSYPTKSWFFILGLHLGLIHCFPTRFKTIKKRYSWNWKKHVERPAMLDIWTEKEISDEPIWQKRQWRAQSGCRYCSTAGHLTWRDKTTKTNSKLAEKCQRPAVLAIRPLWVKEFKRNVFFQYKALSGLKLSKSGFEVHKKKLTYKICYQIS